ncbi:MAG: glutamate 5-kinase [Rikenellaceae bacterium]
MEREEKRYRRVVVKIGSNVLTRKDGSIDSTRISSLTDQVAALYRAGVEVILVSSGAVASGRSVITPSKKLDSVASRQLFSAVGQAKLINKYYNLFSEYNIVCGQVLTTKQSLSTRDHYLNQKHCMKVMLENGVVPIINENDTISVTELMFTDNDELSGLVATMMSADALVILSNIDGLYSGDPKDPASEVIRRVSGDGESLDQYISTTRSQFGRGGMLTKSRIACKVADEGVEVIIANGKREDILVDLVLNNEDIICTRFTPSAKPISELKKWIAHSDGFAKGALKINQGAYEALTTRMATSLLTVGVVEVDGEFERDDIITIISPMGEHIGVGRSSMDSTTARESIGKRGLKPIIHYDYLYLD